MRYWWVNQNLTFRQEIGGGYLWSPKRKKDDQRNYFYETMREVAPGDMVFSFANTLIAAIGTATSFVREDGRPSEFGDVGLNWSDLGWRVDVTWTRLSHAIRPKDFMRLIAPTLPEKYSPLQPSGNGNQGIYLTEVPPPMAVVLINLIGPEASQLVYSSVETAAETTEPYLAARSTEEEVAERLDDLKEREIASDPTLNETEKKALIKARKGQGQFRKEVFHIERFCRVTHVDNPVHLIASHIKPWRHSDNHERLDAENGLLLTPSIDHLFDHGFISFSDSGKLICSPVADNVSLKKMGVPVGQEFGVGAFTVLQKRYLEYHRDEILKARQR